MKNKVLNFRPVENNEDEGQKTVKIIRLVIKGRFVRKSSKRFYPIITFIGDWKIMEKS